MSQEIPDAFKKVIEIKLLELAILPLSSFINDNLENLDLTYTAKSIEIVEYATLLDIDLVKVQEIVQNDEILSFQAVIDAEVDIEETVQRNREVECVSKWFTITCSIDIDDIDGTFSINEIRAY